MPEFFVTNPGQSEFYADVQNWTLKRYQDVSLNSRELTITVPKKKGDNPPIQQFAQIEMRDGSDISFRGYVERYKFTKNAKTYYCKGVENLLYHRFLHKWNYALVVFADSSWIFYTLGNVIKDHYTAGYPITSTANRDNCPGILHAANSLMPWGMPYTIVDEAKKIVKYAGWGSSNSRLGANPVLYYIDDKGVQPLTHVDWAGLQTTDIAFYIDPTDLYIRHTTNTGAGNVGANDYWYDSGRILADNMFDTKVRIGNVDYSDYELVGFLRFDHKKSAAEVLFSIFRNFGLYVRIRDEADGYTYIDGDYTDQGRGKDAGFYQIAESECTVFEKSTPSKPLVHSMRGYGPAEEVYSYAPNPGYKGFWYEDIAEVTDGFKDSEGILADTTQAEFLNRQVDYQYLLQTGRKIIARPGDYIKVSPDYEVAEILPINSIQTDDKGITKLELNNSMPLITEAWVNAGVLGTTYTNYLKKKYGVGPKTGSCNFNMRTQNLTNCAFGTVDLACPNFTSWYHPLVTLDVSLSLPLNGSDLPILDPERFIVFLGVGAASPAFNRNSIIYNYAWGDPISDIDITNLVTPGASNKIWVQVLYTGGIPGATCINSQPVTASVTMNFWNRCDLWG